MKWVLLIPILMFQSVSYGDDLKCLKRMAKDTHKTTQQLTMIFMVCAVKQLEGDRIYLNQGLAWTKLRKKLYPKASGDDMGPVEMSRRTFELTACQEVSLLKTLYLEKCNAKKLPEKIADYQISTTHVSSFVSNMVEKQILGGIKCHTNSH